MERKSVDLRKVEKMIDERVETDVRGILLLMVGKLRELEGLVKGAENTDG